MDEISFTLSFKLLEEYIIKLRMSCDETQV